MTNVPASTSSPQLVIPALLPDECRVLGVLIEKAQTTPNQYPLSLNAIVDGSNQKNNRDPVTNLTEDAAFEAVESLRHKGLVLRQDLSNSRVPKFRHLLEEKQGLNKRQTALMAELLLRGPQTLGELRGRASRMHPFDSMEMVRSVLEGMMQMETPLVRRLPPSAGIRVERFMQVVCPELHPIDVEAESAQTPAAPSSQHGGGMQERVAKLERQVAMLRSALTRMSAALGEADPIAEAEFDG